MSLVIPAHKEETYLPRLLDSVELARGRYRLGADAVEVIVADNASTDETADIARSWGCRVVYVKRRRIAAARNGGAAVARGDVLAFVDADSCIHPETFNALDDALGSIISVPGITFSPCSAHPQGVSGPDAHAVDELCLAVGGHRHREGNGERRAPLERVGVGDHLPVPAELLTHLDGDRRVLVVA